MWIDELQDLSAGTLESAGRAEEGGKFGDGAGFRSFGLMRGPFGFQLPDLRREALPPGQQPSIYDLSNPRRLLRSVESVVYDLR